jgi:hypothetical protein
MIIDYLILTVFLLLVVINMAYIDKQYIKLLLLSGILLLLGVLL